MTDGEREGNKYKKEDEQILERPVILVKRKLGRSETTGEYKVKLAKEAQKEIEREERKEREILDPRWVPQNPRSYRDFQRMIEKNRRNYRRCLVMP